MTTQKVDRKARIPLFIENIKAIVADELMDKPGEVGKRHKKITALCTNEKRYLGEGRTKEQSLGAHKAHKISSSTFMSYLSDYRNAIKALNAKGINTDRDIKKIQANFKEVDLSALDADMPVLRENLMALKKQYRDTHEKLYEALLRLRIEPFAFYAMRPKVNVIQRVNEAGHNQVYAKHAKPRSINLAIISRILADLGDSPHWVDLTIFVALASGRRSVEVLSMATFEGVDEQHVLFSGQAKTKTRRDNTSYVIPTLVPSNILIEVHARLCALMREKVFYDVPFEQLSNEQINSSTSGLLNKRVKVLFNDDKTTFKDLRALYAKRAAMLFHSPTELTESAFYSTILGHSEKDVSTQLSYQGLLIVEPVEAVPIEPFAFLSDGPHWCRESVRQLNDIKGFDTAVVEQGGKGVARIHAFVKTILEDHPDMPITQTFLSRAKSKGGGGFNRNSVKAYLGLVGLGIQSNSGLSKK